MSSSEKKSVDIAALTKYASQLGHYRSEAGKFEELVSRADVTGEAWGVMGVWAKQSYTERLADLQSLLAEMKQGVETLTAKVTQSAAIYRGDEDDKVIKFGRHEAGIDGPR